MNTRAIIAALSLYSAVACTTGEHSHAGPSPAPSADPDDHAHALMKPFSICEYEKAADLVLDVSVVGWGTAQNLTFTGFSGTFQLTPINLIVNKSFKGTAGSTLTAYVRRPVNSSGGSIEGALGGGASGYAFIHSRDGYLLVASGGLFLRSAKGTVRNEGSYLEGITEADFLNQLSQSNATVVCTPLDAMPPTAAASGAGVPMPDAGTVLGPKVVP